MKEIKLDKSPEQTIEQAPSLQGKLKNSVDRAFYQNKQTWQKEDSERTISIFRNAIKGFPLDSIEELSAAMSGFLSKNPINFPDENLVAEIKRELREAIGEALRRAASRATIKHESLMSLHEVLLDADLGILKEIYGSNYLFQIAKDILKAHHRIDQFDVYGTVTDIIGIHEQVVRDLRDDYLNYFNGTDPITSFILKGESVVKELEKELELLVALAVGDEAGFKAQLAQVSNKVKLAEAKRALAKKASSNLFAIILGLISFLALFLIGADYLIAIVLGLGIGLGIYLLTS